MSMAKSDKNEGIVTKKYLKDWRGQMKKKYITWSKHESKEVLGERKQKFEVIVTQNQTSTPFKEEMDSSVTSES